MLLPAVFTAKSNNQDTYSWDKAMNSPHKTVKELKTLIEMCVWEVIDRKPWMVVLPTTWAFRVKRFTDGTVRKSKGRSVPEEILRYPEFITIRINSGVQSFPGTLFGCC